MRPVTGVTTRGIGRAFERSTAPRGAWRLRFLEHGLKEFDKDDASRPFPCPYGTLWILVVHHPGLKSGAVNVDAFSIPGLHACPEMEKGFPWSG